MNSIGKLMRGSLAAVVIAMAASSITISSAHADRDDWRHDRGHHGDHWREREWRDHDHRGEGWRARRYDNRYYYGERYYVAPPVVYGPPPPPPGLNLLFNVR